MFRSLNLAPHYADHFCNALDFGGSGRISYEDLTTILQPYVEPQPPQQIVTDMSAVNSSQDYSLWKTHVGPADESQNLQRHLAIALKGVRDVADASSKPSSARSSRPASAGPTYRRVIQSGERPASRESLSPSEWHAGDKASSPAYQDYDKRSEASVSTSLGMSQTVSHATSGSRPASAGCLGSARTPTSEPRRAADIREAEERQLGPKAARPSSARSASSYCTSASSVQGHKSASSTATANKAKSDLKAELDDLRSYLRDNFKTQKPAKRTPKRKVGSYAADFRNPMQQALRRRSAGLPPKSSPGDLRSGSSRPGSRRSESSGVGTSATPSLRPATSSTADSETVSEISSDIMRASRTPFPGHTPELSPAAGGPSGDVSLSNREVVERRGIGQVVPTSLGQVCWISPPPKVPHNHATWNSSNFTDARGWKAEPKWGLRSSTTAQNFGTEVNRVLPRAPVYSRAAGKERPLRLAQWKRAQIRSECVDHKGQVLLAPGAHNIPKTYVWRDSAKSDLPFTEVPPEEVPYTIAANLDLSRGKASLNSGTTYMDHSGALIYDNCSCSVGAPTVADAIASPRMTAGIYS